MNTLQNVDSVFPDKSALSGRPDQSVGLVQLSWLLYFRALPKAASNGPLELR